MGNALFLCWLTAQAELSGHASFPACRLCCNCLVQLYPCALPVVMIPKSALRSAALHCPCWKHAALADKGDWTVHSEYVILVYMAFSTTLMDYWGITHTGLGRLQLVSSGCEVTWASVCFSLMSLPVKDIAFWLRELRSGWCVTNQGCALLLWLGHE